MTAWPSASWPPSPHWPVSGSWSSGPSATRPPRSPTQVTQERARLDQATAGLAAAEAAKARYGDDYATVARLGKAVTEQDDVASLVYQIESVAKANKIDFRSIKLESAGAAAAAPQPAAQPPVSQVAQAGTNAKEGSSADPAPAGRDARRRRARDAPLGVAGLPPGAAVGPAGFPLMPFTLQLRGQLLPDGGLPALARRVHPGQGRGDQRPRPPADDRLDHDRRQPQGLPEHQRADQVQRLPAAFCGGAHRRRDRCRHRAPPSRPIPPRRPPARARPPRPRQSPE